MGQFIPLQRSHLDQSAPSDIGLIPFAQRTKPNYTAAAVHRLIADHLEAVERGAIQRLLIETPPRIGKSELVSVRFPAWYLGRNPDRRIIQASHSARLAHAFGRKARNIVEMPVFGELYPGVDTARDLAARDQWDIEGHEGGYIAAGVGGPITGSGGDVAIIDDPVKDRRQADSPTYRDDVWEWYNDVLVTRLEGERAAVILTMTRWHQDDLAGRILESEPGEWTVLRLPALAEHDDPLGREIGEALWPEKFSEKYLARLQATDLDFDALYQQNPTARSGATFRRDWFEESRFDAGDLSYRNRSIGRWLFWDTGLKDKESSDYSACAVLEMLPDYRVLVREVYRGKMQFPALVGAIEDMSIRYNRDEKLRGVVIEDKASGTSAYQTLQQAAPDWLRGLLIPFQPLGSKEYRAAQASVWVRNACVMMPWPSEYVPWLADFEAELFGFPSAAHDDQVDAFVEGILYVEHFLSEGFHARMAVTAEESVLREGMAV